MRRRPTLVLRLGLLASTCPIAVVAPRMFAQMPGSTVPATTRLLGTLTGRTSTSLTVKPDSGDAVTIALTPETSVLSLAPGSTDLKSAQPATVADLEENDRVLVLLSPGAGSPTARRVLLMKSTAIVAQQQKVQQQWRQSRGGVVTSVDPAAGSVTLQLSGRTLAVSTSPTTLFRQYAPGSVRFEDAKRSTLGAIQAGDQVRVRGTMTSPSTLAADELVFGAFLQLAGQLTSVDLSASQLVLRDSKTKALVNVTLTPHTEVRSLPPALAEQLAAQSTAAGHRVPAAHDAAAGAAGQHASDPAEAISQLPSLSLSSLKTGDSVLLVATAGPNKSNTATTVLTGVAPILTAMEGGGAATSLTAWSLGGGSATSSE